MSKTLLSRVPISDLKLYARNDLAFFSRALGFDNAPFHESWYNVLTPKDDPTHFSPFREHPRALKKYHIEGPRKHGKSQAIGINYPLWLIGKNPNIHITLVSKTSTLAENNLNEIIERIEHDENFHRIFGELKPQNPQKWTGTQIFIEREKISKFPTIHATGLYGPLTGGGSDLIIADDVIDEQNVTTRNQIEKASRWFHKVLLTTLFPWGAVIAIGTRWHYNDLYSQFLESWEHEVHKAILNPEEIIKGQEPQVLWPEVWSYHRLMEKKEDIGTLFFNCQYMNDPSGMEGALLKNEWLHTYEKLPLQYLTFAGVDPALGEGDLQSVATMGYARDRRQGYLIDVWADNVPFPQFLQKLRELHSIYHYSKIFVESNSFQKLLIQIPEFVQGMPIVESPTVRGKEPRFIAMSSHYEAKRVLVSPSLKSPKSEFWNEWVQFPHGQYDDALDSTEIVTRNVITLQPKPAFRFG